MLLNKDTPSPAQYQKIMPDSNERAFKDGPAVLIKIVLLKVKTSI